MLDLGHPLWTKLDAAFRDQKVPKLLSELATSWDEEKARSLFWDTLCHQDSCYGATYAAIPHLLGLAELHDPKPYRLEVALFLGYVALCALERGNIPPLPGLPETLDGWDRKLEPYRQLVSVLEHKDQLLSDYEKKQLRHYHEVLAIEPVNGDDLRHIHQIRAEFLIALPRIGALCERALLENVSDHEAGPYLLSGIAAADGLTSLARLLSFGSEGFLSCSNCHWPYEYARFGERIALYAEIDNKPGVNARDQPDRAVADYREGVPSRCDAFLIPSERWKISDDRALRIWSLAERATNANANTLLQHFLGRIPCCKCGVHAPIESPVGN
jgi:hypothetical protein